MLERSVLPSTAVCIFAHVHVKTGLYTTSPYLKPPAGWILLALSGTVEQDQHQQEYGPKYFFTAQVRPEILFTERTGNLTVGALIVKSIKSSLESN